MSSNKKELRSLYLLPKHLQPQDVIKNKVPNEERKDLHLLNGCKRIQRIYGKLEKSTPFTQLFDDIKPFFSAANFYSYCLCFVQFDVDKKDAQKGTRWMVFSLGDGWKVLNYKNLERSFGLITAQNMVDLEKMTLIEIQTMERATRFFRSSVPHGGTTSDHRIYEEEIYRRVGGKVKTPGSESSVFGNDSNLKVRICLSKKMMNDEDLPELCSKYFDFYKLQTDKIFNSKLQPVKEDDIIADLNKKLVEAIANTFSNKDHKPVDMIYPWTEKPIDYEWTKFISPKQYLEDLTSWEGKENDELTFEEYVSCVKTKCFKDRDVFENNNIGKTLELLEKHKVEFYGRNFPEDEFGFDSYSVKKCILFQTKHKKDEYVLWEGRWHLLSSNYLKHIKAYFNDRIVDPPNFPTYKGDLLIENEWEKENAYNKDAAKKLKYLCLDTMTVGIGGSAEHMNKFEYCDLLSREGKMCHVKFYGGLKTLGYLFNQGFVSGKALIEDSKVREKVQKLVKTKGGQDFLNAIEKGSEKKTICFVIIARKETRLVQVSMIFHEHARKLEDLGYKVEIEWPIDKTPPPKKANKRKTKNATTSKTTTQNKNVTTTATTSFSQASFSQSSGLPNFDTLDLDTDAIQQNSSSLPFSNTAMILNQCDATISQPRNKRSTSTSDRASEPKDKHKRS